MIDKISKKFSRSTIFLSRWRSFSSLRLLQYPFMFASVPMLAYEIKPYGFEIIKLIIFTIIALYSGFFATLLWNDITDKDIDAIAHPERPLPAGRISVKRMFMIALMFSVLTFLFSYLVSFWCFIFVGAVALFVAFHNKFFKKIIKLPAFSELTTPLQWLIVPIFGFLAVWTVFPSSGEITITFPIFGYISFDYIDFQNMIILAIFTYFADGAHDLPEGIHDIEGDRKLGVRTYASSFGEKNAARVSFIMFFISGILGILLFIRTILSPIFLVLFLILWTYALFYSYRLLKADKKEMKDVSKIVGQKTFRYFWLTYDIIFLDLFIHLILFN